MNIEDVERLRGQKRLILERLAAGERLTPLQALQWGCQRLGARIWDLRQIGAPVRDHMVRVRKATTGQQADVKEYWLEAPDAAQARQLLAATAGGRRRGQTGGGPPQTETSSSSGGDLPGRAIPARPGRPPPAAKNGPDPRRGVLWEDVDRPVGYG